MTWKFSARTNRYRKTNRAETFEFDILNGLGVVVSWHEDRNDDEGERVDVVQHGGGRYAYGVPVMTKIRVVICVPPALFDNLEDRGLATAMLMHEGFGSSCALSHLDDITKDALLRMIVGPLTYDMTLTHLFVGDEGGVEEPEDAVALKPSEPFELVWPLQFHKPNDTPCFWIVRDEQNKNVVELMFYVE